MSGLVDLSHTIEEGMVTYPGLPGPVIGDHLSREESRAHYAAGTEFHIGRIEMVANTGTYLDSPSHRYRDGKHISELPLEKLAELPGVCLEVESQEITPAHLEGIDADGKAVLFATGWDAHWRTDRYGAPDHPYLSAGAVEALIANGAALVGIDSVNIDDTRQDSRPAHSALLGAEVPIVEHLTGLGRLVGESFRFFAVPAPVRGLGTFPVRAFAVIE